MLSVFQVSAQHTSYDISPLSGNTSFVYTQTPEPLISQVPGITGATYQWQSSAGPINGFTIIAGATSETYSFSSPLSNTTFYRRVTTKQSVSYTSNVIKIQVVSANWENLNYVREHEVLVAGQTDWKIIDQLAIGSKLQTTTYMDGLGRSIQKVSRGTALQPNNLWGDAVQFSTFDALGRQDKQWLPYTTTAQPGKFKTATLTDQPQYYANLYNESSAYSKVATYDNSPLNRALKVNEPGENWTNSAGSKVMYDLNDATENIPIFSIGYNTGDLPVSAGTYAAKTLFKTTYTDEAGNDVIDYTDQSGKLILKKVELSKTHADAYDNWICTYSVYDDFDQLRFRMQPEAIKWLAANGWSFTGTTGQKVADELCFRYEYDDKGRTVLKKAPGAKELLMLYDNRDRVVFMQDGNQRLKSPAEWTANLYDELDRPILSTLYRTAKTGTTPAGANLQTDIDNAVTLTPVTVVNPGGIQSDLTINHRQTGISRYAATNSIEFVADAGGNFETVLNDNFVAEIDAAALTQTVSVSIATYKSPVTTSDLGNASVTTILKYLFYDNYTYATVKPFSTVFDNTQAYTTGDPITPTQRTTNMPTGSMVRVLNTNTFLTTSFYYDEKGRPIQASEENIKGGMDVTTNQYQFDGRLLSSATRHTTANSGYTNYSVVTKNIFDDIGRVTSIQKKYGSNAFKTIATYDMDDMGRLKTKHLAPGYSNITTGKNEIESLNYSYNIHNQITGINKDYALKTAGSYNKWGNYFGLCLGFNKDEGVFSNTLLNGQVSGIVWNTQGDDAQRKFDFTYDAAGRLTNALFKERQNTGDGWLNTKMDFSTTGYNGKIEYDLNGNLLAMLQKGVVPGNNTPVTMDDLRYTYASYSNKLTKVTDLGNLAANNGKLGDFADGANGTGDDYVYDDNGNLVIDLNKSATNVTGGVTTAIGVSGIKYNFLDKPEEIKITGKGTIKIVYDADGNKLQKLFTKEGTTSTTVTSYINQFVYEQTSTGTGDGTLKLQYINFEEGRIRVMEQVAQNNGFDFLTIDGNMDMPENKRGAWDFFVRDYQSNVRMILTEETHEGSNSCTMETARAVNEEPVFGEVDANGTPTSANEVKARVATSSIPGQTSNGGWTNNTSAYVARLGNLAGKKVGPNVLMKVMAGDQVSARTMYYYENAVTNSSGGPSLLNDLLTSLVNAISGSSASSLLKGNASMINSQLTGNIPFNTINEPDYNNASGNTPKAYMTMVFFDERFNVIPENSSAQRVQQSGPNATDLIVTNREAPKNGYCYVYVSNESNEMVYFDNLQVSNKHARIIEENHYYSYGLKIAAISSKKIPDPAEGKLKNNYQYQGDYSEFDEETGWNEFALRDYDPQVGRWIQVDPYDEFPSPYTGMGNDPINNVDPSGGGIFDGLSTAAKIGVSTLGGAIVGTAIDIFSGGDGSKGLAIGAGAGLLGGLGGTFGLSAITGAATKGVGDIAGSAGSQNPYSTYSSNVSANDGQIRKDRSRMFTNQNEAYSWMFRRTMANNYKEVLAIILEKSVLVLPDYLNTQSETTAEDYGYSWVNGNLRDPITKKTLHVVATIHTHLAPWGNPNPSSVDSKGSGGDVAYFARNTPNKPYLTMGQNGKIYGNYGKWIKKGNYNRDIQTSEIAFDRGIERVTNGMILKNFPLREYLQYYMKHIAKIP